VISEFSDQRVSSIFKVSRATLSAFIIDLEALMMSETHLLERPGITYRATRRHIPEERDRTHYCENLETHNNIFIDILACGLLENYTL
jgi:hypothetical protein